MRLLGKIATILRDQPVNSEAIWLLISGTKALGAKFDYLKNVFEFLIHGDVLNIPLFYKSIEP